MLPSIEENKEIISMGRVNMAKYQQLFHEELDLVLRHEGQKHMQKDEFTADEKSVAEFLGRKYLMVQTPSPGATLSSSVVQSEIQQNLSLDNTEFYIAIDALRRKQIVTKVGFKRWQICPNKFNSLRLAADQELNLGGRA